MHSLLISLPILMYKTFDPLQFIAFVHNEYTIYEPKHL